MGTYGEIDTRLRDGLLDAQNRAENGDYKVALDSVRSVKSAHPRNIYVLAFEKQLEQLHQLHTDNQLTDDQKLDIIESLPGIVERAMEGHGAELSNGQTAVFKPLTEEAVKQREEKGAALEWLKNQYFQHAHEYVRKGEYENALAEIRRVFIIEPSNQIARDFESQIRQLSQLKRTRMTEPPAPPRPAAPPPPPPAPAPRPQYTAVPEAPADPEPAPAAVREDPPQRPAQDAPKKKSRMSNWVVVAILLTIAVIGFGVFYFIVRPHRVERLKHLNAGSPTGNAIFSPPSTTEEQTFVISTDPSEQIAAAETPPIDDLRQPSDSSPAEQPVVQEKKEQPATRLPEPVVTESGPNVTPAGNPPQQQPTVAETQNSRNTQQAQEEPSAEPFIPVEQPPQILNLEKPRFSDAAYKQGLEGQIVVQVQIDPQGRPQQAKVVSSTNPLLEEAVLDAVLQSHFVPGRMSSGPVASSMLIPFKFRR